MPHPLHGALRAAWSRAIIFKGHAQQRNRSDGTVRPAATCPMVDFNLINSPRRLDDEVDSAVATALGDAADDLGKLVKGDEVQDFSPGAIIKGRVSGMAGDDFIVELGLKSEGILERGEFDEPDNVKRRRRSAASCSKTSKATPVW